MQEADPGGGEDQDGKARVGGQGKEGGSQENELVVVTGEEEAAFSLAIERSAIFGGKMGVEVMPVREVIL